MTQITLRNSRVIKGLLFDMDGTMIDNMMIHHRAWQNKLAEYGLDMTLEEVKEKIHGINEEILLRLFGDRFTAEERKRIAFEKEAEYRKIYAPELHLISGLHSFLDEVKAAGIPMAIGTAAPPENANFVLDALNLRDYFGGVFHSKSVKKGKPNPEIFELAASSLGLSPKECIVFEDSVTGAGAANNAGALSIIVTTTHHASEFTQFDNVLAFITDYEGFGLELLRRL